MSQEVELEPGMQVYMEKAQAQIPMLRAKLDDVCLQVKGLKRQIIQ